MVMAPLGSGAVFFVTFWRVGTLLVLIKWGKGKFALLTEPCIAMVIVQQYKLIVKEKRLWRCIVIKGGMKQKLILK